jgi:hypothetical protein
MCSVTTIIVTPMLRSCLLASTTMATSPGSAASAPSQQGW